MDLALHSKLVSLMIIARDYAELTETRSPVVCFFSKISVKVPT